MKLFRDRGLLPGHKYSYLLSPTAQFIQPHFIGSAESAVWLDDDMPFNDLQVSEDLLQVKGDFRLEVNMNREYQSPEDMR